MYGYLLGKKYPRKQVFFLFEGVGYRRAPRSVTVALRVVLCLPGSAPGGIFPLLHPDGRVRVNSRGRNLATLLPQSPVAVEVYGDS